MARECVDDIRSRITPVDFGYRVQALAGHVLLRLGYRIETVNQRGHPDILAVRDGLRYCFEIEAEVGRPRPRKLTDSDLEVLMDVPDGLGYYALSISFPYPRWIVVRASSLVDRIHAAPNVLLEALSDKAYSQLWTAEYVNLLNASCCKIKTASFASLTASIFSGGL